MILFIEDWAKYPTAKIHMETKNESFLRLAELYRTMGVKNCYFHLALLQPELTHVDPFDPNLSEEMMLKIALECRYNPWYFFREVLRIPPTASNDPIPFIAARGNIGLFWSFFNHVDLALIQPRQTGKSVGDDSLDIYIIFIGARNTRVNKITKDDQLRTANIERLKKMRDFLPHYLNPYDKRKDPDNKHEIKCSAYGNVYSIVVGQNSEAAALNVGRGLTSAINKFDEAPFIPYIDVVIPAMLASGTAARDEAAKHGTLYGNVYTTTAGKKNSRSGAFMYKLIHGGMTWTEKVFDFAGNDELKKVVKRQSIGELKKPILNITLSHRQLGKTDKWLRDKMSEAAATGEDADRDFGNRWTAGGLSSPLTIEVNEALQASHQEVLYLEVTSAEYLINWYIPEDSIEAFMQNNHVVIGMDTSDAVGKDSITMVMLDAKTLKTVATSYVNETNIHTYATFVSDFLIKYKNTVLIPERRSSGQSIIDIVMVTLVAAGIDPFKRIYNSIIDESMFLKPDFSPVLEEMYMRPTWFHNHCKKYMGYVTSGSGKHSRSNLYSETLTRAASMACDHVYDRRLIDELTGLVVKDGRINHTSDSHDDMVIGWLLAIWFLLYSKNLSHYGITNALCDVKEFKAKAAKQAEVDPLDQYFIDEQKDLREEVNKLIEELDSCTNEFATRAIETRLKYLSSRLRDVSTESKSLDEVLQKADEERYSRYSLTRDPKDIRY